MTTTPSPSHTMLEAADMLERLMCNPCDMAIRLRTEAAKLERVERAIAEARAQFGPTRDPLRNAPLAAAHLILIMDAARPILTASDGGEAFDRECVKCGARFAGENTPCPKCDGGEGGEP